MKTTNQDGGGSCARKSRQASDEFIDIVTLPIELDSDDQSTAWCGRYAIWIYLADLRTCAFDRPLS